MATLNDFKVVKAKSQRMFEFLEKELHLSPFSDPNVKARLGFYHLVLESVTQNPNIREISEAIIDQEYNDKIYHIKTDDLGIDAVYIYQNGTENEVALFNFKHRDNFSEKNQEETAISRSTKFIEYCLSEDSLPEGNEKVSGKIETIRNLINRDETCNLKLYMVSNDKYKHVSTSETYIKILEESYGMEIISLALDDVVKFVCKKPKEKTCSFVIKANDFLMWNRNELSTEYSYIVKLSLIDVIRITCRSDSLANEYNIENDDKIKGEILDTSLLYDNVRGYLGETTFNSNIQKTLQNEPENFFMFNNGLTFITSDLNVREQNAKTKYKFSLKGFQLVNGGQTIRSIYSYLNSSDDAIIEKLRKAQVLIRIFKVSEGDDENSNLIKSHIAEYTNSQNAINVNDLKSVDYRQIQIEEFLKQNNILYARKAGDVGDERISYERRITMTLLAKILYSYMGHPERVSSQKKKLFSDYYEEVFGNTLNLDELPSLINLFYSVLAEDCSEQKAAYVIYIMTKKSLSFTQENIKATIQTLNQAINSYTPKTAASDARKLIQKAFKEHLDSLL